MHPRGAQIKPMFIILALTCGIGYTASPAGPAESASQIMPRTTTAHGSIRTPLLAWGALVVIPALVTAVFLLRVTRREQARYSDRLEQAALAEGHQVALDLRRHLQVLRDEAALALQAIAPDAWLQELPVWADNDSTIRASWSR